jgi:hypothetical protein
VFTLAVKHHDSGKSRVFEFSNRLNELDIIIRFLNSLGMSPDTYMVGFNNLGYDYPVLDYIYNNHYWINPESIFEFSNEIIKSKDKFKYHVWPSNMIAQQIDLYKINHYDNHAKSTSLKIIEFNLQAGWLQELPFKPGTTLNNKEIDELKDYNLNRDVVNTERFFIECLPQIEFRRNLSLRYGLDFLNSNDSKIGGDFLTLRIIEKKHGRMSDHFEFYKYRKQLGKTPRPGITLDDIILNYIDFNHAGFKNVLNWLKSVSIIDTKECFKNLTVEFNGLSYHFGTGGIHGCIVGKNDKPKIFESDDQYLIMDVDVASYYPNLSIVNGFYPEHLGVEFCEAYRELYEERKKHKKGTDLNALFKIALNGTYGNSNSKYSVFYDPKFTMSITINGQLLLCMLAEMLQGAVPASQMIQINTDGLTIKIDRRYESQLNTICQQWENLTGLELESVKYAKVLIKDVNNYAALKDTGGKPKLKGKYEYIKPHHKNQSALVVPKIVEDFFLSDFKNFDVLQALRNHDDMMDFMLRTKIPRSSSLELGGEKIQNVSRYYISNKGGELIKVMPPLKKNPNKPRRIGVNVGWNATECNEIHKVNPSDINYDYYYQEIIKLLPEGVI